MARQSKYTPELVDEIVNGVVVGLTDKDAALAAGISENTLHVWRRRYRDFDSRLMRARKQRSRLMLKRIHEAGKTDWKAAAELLDRTDREYRKTPLEITGKNGGPIQHEVTVLDAAVKQIAAERGLDPADVLAEAERIMAEGREVGA